MSYISGFSDFALYFEDYSMNEFHAWDIGSVLILKTIPWMNFILRILVPFQTTIELITYVGHVTNISGSSDFAIYIEYFSMDEVHTLDIGTM